MRCYINYVSIIKSVFPKESIVFHFQNVYIDLILKKRVLFFSWKTVTAIYSLWNINIIQPSNQNENYLHSDILLGRHLFLKSSSVKQTFLRFSIVFLNVSIKVFTIAVFLSLMIQNRLSAVFLINFAKLSSTEDLSKLNLDSYSDIICKFIASNNMLS